jgi:hypothetical protein
MAHPRCSRCDAPLDEDEMFPDTLTPSCTLIGSRTRNIGGSDLAEAVIRILCRTCFTFLLDQVDSDPLDRVQGHA